MRSRILLAVLLVALVALAPARAAPFTVTITAAGFTPKAVTVGVGDTVTWVNADVSSHQVESKSAGFTSQLLKPGERHSFVYKAAGRFPYQDMIVKKNKGTVTVAAGAATVTQKASRSLVVYGQTTTLSGAVSSKVSGQTVTSMLPVWSSISPARRIIDGISSGVMPSGLAISSTSAPNACIVRIFSTANASEDTIRSGYPLIAHTNASDEPVLPPVYSTTGCPGASRPSRSAASIIASAIRSL